MAKKGNQNTQDRFSGDNSGVSGSGLLSPGGKTANGEGKKSLLSLSTVLVMTYILGMSKNQIAKETGASSRTITRLLSSTGAKLAARELVGLGVKQSLNNLDYVKLKANFKSSEVHRLTQLRDNIDKQIKVYLQVQEQKDFSRGLFYLIKSRTEVTTQLKQALGIQEKDTSGKGNTLNVNIFQALSEREQDVKKYRGANSLDSPPPLRAEGPVPKLCRRTPEDTAPLPMIQSTVDSIRNRIESFSLTSQDWNVTEQRLPEREGEEMPGEGITVHEQAGISSGKAGQEEWDV